MWIREALVDAPRGAWRGVALSWARTALLALAAVGVGATVDALLGDRSWLQFAALSGLAAALGAVCGGFAEALPGKIQGEEELDWRQRVLRRAILGGRARSAGQNHGHERGSGKSQGQGHGHGARGGTSHGGRNATGEGALVDAASTGVEKTANYRAGFLGPTLASFTSPLVVLIIWVIFVDALTAVILLVFVALVPMVIIAVGKWLRKPNSEYRRKETAAANQYLEMLEGIGTMKVLGAAPAARDRFAESARSAMRELGTLLGRNQLMIIVNDGVFGLLMSGVAIVLVLAGLASGNLSAGAALAGVLLTVLLNEPIDRVGRTFYVGLAGRARRDQLDALVGAAPQPARDDAGSAAPSTETAGADTKNAARQQPVQLDLRGISVTIKGKQILENVTLSIPAGGRVALVGPSGAGKSTLMRVIAGTAELQDGAVVEGDVLVNGAPATTRQLRSLVTSVAQNPGILSTTIADNLRLVAPDASDEALLAALGRAHLRAEVEAMPNQLETSVGDRGAFLSGGQRRRLAIARAFLRQRPLLLLDEPTADLDRRTEALVRASLDEVTQGRTVVQIAHRLDTTLDADVVAVISDGHIVAIGTPDDLRAQDGYYSNALHGEENDER